MKTHILRSHPVAWHKCNPAISQGHGVFAKALKRDSACPYCEKIVFGTSRHLTQCPVIVQVVLLHQLAVLEVDPYDVQSNPVHINKAQAARLLTNYEEASNSDQVPGLLHKCFICQADICDIQTWRRHMKQHHSQVWKQLEGSLKSAVMAQPLPRPCPYCKTQYQKTPAVHVGKHLALQQLLAIRDRPQEQIEHGRSSRADSSTLGEPKPTGPGASQKSAEEGEWQRREQIHEESSTTKEDNSTTARRGVGRRASTGSTKRGHEHSAENVSTPRARHTDVGSGSPLRIAPVHKGVVNPTAVFSRKPEDSAHDVHPPGTSSKVAEGRLRSISHSESASRMANHKPEMAVLGMASSGPQVDADNPHSNHTSGHHEDDTGAHPGSGKAELRASLPLNPATQGELPNRVSDHATHAVHAARGSQATQPLHGDGRSVGHAAHRHADQAGAQQTRKACRGAPQTSAKTLAHYFQQGAVTSPRAAAAGPVPEGRLPAGWRQG